MQKVNNEELFEEVKNKRISLIDAANSISVQINEFQKEFNAYLRKLKNKRLRAVQKED